MCGSDIFLALIAILFPPLAVWVKKGICSADSLINILLCVLGFVPGLLHAWYIIAVTPDPTYEELHDAEQGRVTYYYVTPAQHPPQPSQPPRQQQQGRRGYGAVNAPPPPPQQQQYQQSQQPPRLEAQAATASGSGSGGNDTPPSYQQAVAGDHKIQGP